MYNYVGIVISVLINFTNIFIQLCYMIDVNRIRCINTVYVLYTGRMIGDDPHFSIVLPDSTSLCYTVQGEQGFVFSLISNKMLHMNAMFVPDSRREEVTWLGSIGIVVHNNGFKTSNATYLRFEAKSKKIYIGDNVVLKAKNIEKLSFNNGKLTISEAPPFEGFKTPSVDIELQNVGLHFTTKFMNEHLDLFWHCTGHETQDSHGLIGESLVVNCMQFGLVVIGASLSELHIDGTSGRFVLQPSAARRALGRTKVSKTSCSHFSSQGSYYGYTHAWTKLYNEVTSCIMDSHWAASVLGAGSLLSCFRRSFGI